MNLRPFETSANGWPKDGADYVVFVQKDVRYQMYFLSDGRVRMHTEHAGKKTIRQFEYLDGQWVKENFDG